MAADENLSAKALPLAREFIAAYKKDDRKEMERIRDSAEKVLGARAFPASPTKDEVEDPELLAKRVSCIAQILPTLPKACISQGYPLKRIKGERCYNPFAVCRTSVQPAEASANPDVYAQIWNTDSDYNERLSVLLESGFAMPVAQDYAGRAWDQLPLDFRQSVEADVARELRAAANPAAATRWSTVFETTRAVVDEWNNYNVAQGRDLMEAAGVAPRDIQEYAGVSWRELPSHVRDKIYDELRQSLGGHAAENPRVDPAAYWDGMSPENRVAYLRDYGSAEEYVQRYAKMRFSEFPPRSAKMIFSKFPEEIIDGFEVKFNRRSYGGGQFYSWAFYRKLGEMQWKALKVDPWPASRWPKGILLAWVRYYEGGQTEELTKEIQKAEDEYAARKKRTASENPGFTAGGSAYLMPGWERHHYFRDPAGQEAAKVVKKIIKEGGGRVILVRDVLPRPVPSGDWQVEVRSAHPVGAMMGTAVIPWRVIDKTFLGPDFEEQQAAMVGSENPAFEAVEMNIDTGKKTGRVETYVAANRDEATEHLLYTRRLKNGRWQRSGHTVFLGSTAWVLPKQAGENPQDMEEISSSIALAVWDANGHGWVGRAENEKEFWAYASGMRSALTAEEKVELHRRLPETWAYLERRAPTAEIRKKIDVELSPKLGLTRGGWDIEGSGKLLKGNPIVARWEAAKGKRFVELRRESDGTYSYKTDGGGGAGFSFASDADAIAWAEKPWGPGGAGPVTVLKSDFPSVRRVKLPSGENPRVKWSWIMPTEAGSSRGGKQVASVGPYGVTLRRTRDEPYDWYFEIIRKEDGEVIMDGSADSEKYAKEEAVATAQALIEGSGRLPEENPRRVLKYMTMEGWRKVKWTPELEASLATFWNHLDRATRIDILLGEQIHPDDAKDLAKLKWEAQERSDRESFSDAVLQEMEGSTGVRVGENPHTKKVKITWEEFAKEAGFDYAGTSDPRIEESLMDQSSQESLDFIKEYEQKEGIEWDSDDERDEARMIAEQIISDSLGHHWSVQHVIERVVNLDDLVNRVNQWSERGQQMQIYEERVIKAGEGIVNYETDAEGLTFTLADPFMIAYIEAAYCVMSIGDEGMTIKDMDGGNVAATMRRIAECEGTGLRLDLDRWDEFRHGPSYWGVVKAIEKQFPSLKASDNPQSADKIFRLAQTALEESLKTDPPNDHWYGMAIGYWGSLTPEEADLFRKSHPRLAAALDEERVPYPEAVFAEIAENPKDPTSIVDGMIDAIEEAYESGAAWKAHNRHGIAQGYWESLSMEEQEGIEAGYPALAAYAKNETWFETEGEDLHIRNDIQNELDRFASEGYSFARKKGKSKSNPAVKKMKPVRSGTVILNRHGTDLITPDGVQDGHIRLERNNEIAVDVFEAAQADPDKAYIAGELFPATADGATEATEWLHDHGFTIKIQISRRN